MNLLAPSLLAAKADCLGEQAELVRCGGASLLHLDVMDGHFVPNLSYGPHVAQSLSKSATLPLDVHLMVEKPSKFIEPFLRAGASIVNVHVETETPGILFNLISEIRKSGARPAVTIKPTTPITLLEPFLPLVDMVLVMTVEPGYGGQSFLPGSLDRIADVRRMADKLNPACDLEIDGGVTLENCAAALQAGANIIVAGSAVFGANDVSAAAKAFVNILRYTQKRRMLE